MRGFNSFKVILNTIIFKIVADDARLRRDPFLVILYGNFKNLNNYSLVVSSC